MSDRRLPSGARTFFDRPNGPLLIELGIILASLRFFIHESNLLSQLSINTPFSMTQCLFKRAAQNVTCRMVDQSL